MKSVKELIIALKKSIWNSSTLSESRVSRIIEYKLAKRQFDDLALNSCNSGVVLKKEDSEEIIVSLTTHGKRILSVHRTIESIFHQSHLANRVIMYVGDKEFQSPQQLPLILQKQMSRGLEVRFVRDQGPFTKLLPTMRENKNSVIITIDDDIIYPFNLLERLMNAHQAHPNAICGISVISLCIENGQVQTPFYTRPNWNRPQDLISKNFLAQGFGGVLYPPNCFGEEVFNELVFSRLVPSADDAWFKAMSLLYNTPIVLVHGYYSVFDEQIVDEDTQDIGLRNINSKPGESERQLQNLFEHYGLFSKL